jgi:hypothetical protein
VINMTTLLSDDIKETIRMIDSHPLPSPEQIATLLRNYRELLGQVHDFAADLEEARGRSQRAIPLWGGAGTSSRFYTALHQGRRRPTPGMSELRLVETARSA